MKTCHYALASLKYHKLTTIIYTSILCLFMISLTLTYILKNAQLTLLNQIKSRAQFIDPSIEEKLHSPFSASSTLFNHMNLILWGIFFIFIFIFISKIFPIFQPEIKNWLLQNYPRWKLVLLVLCQFIFPLIFTFFVIGIFFTLLQPLIESTIQTLTYDALMHNQIDHALIGSTIDDSTAISVAIPQQSILMIDFTSNFLLSLTIRGLVISFLQLLVGLLANFSLSLFRFHKRNKRIEVHLL